MSLPSSSKFKIMSSSGADSFILKAKDDENRLRVQVFSVSMLQFSLLDSQLHLCLDYVDQTLN